MKEMTNQRVSLFQQPFFVALFAIMAATAWGFAYPLIKLGFGEFAITPEMTGAKMLFAGIRFCVSGLIVLAVAGVQHRDFSLRKAVDVWYILLFCLMNTTLHYAFFYFGLSHSAGSRAAILNALSVFLVVIMACVFFKSDSMTMRKLGGCTIGFMGILLLHVGGGEQAAFSWLGDGMIVLNAVCGAAASLLTRGLGRRVDIFVGTGYSLAVGGALLMVPGLLLHGSLPHVSVVGVVYLLLLIGISTLGFTLYNKLLTCNPVGRVAIYNSLIPIIGAVSSCLCLGEPFYWKYLFAGLLATTGIYLINSGKK